MTDISPYVARTPSTQELITLLCTPGSSGIWQNPLTPQYEVYTTLRDQFYTAVPPAYSQICNNWNPNRPPMTAKLQTMLSDGMGTMYNSVSALQAEASSQVATLSRTLSAALTLQLGPGNNGGTTPPCNLLDPLIQLLSGIGQNFINAATVLANEALSMVNNIANCVLGVIGNLESLILDLYNRMQSLARDIQSLVQRVQDSINKLFNAMQDFDLAKNILDFLNGIPCVGQLIQSSGTQGFKSAVGL